MSIDLLFGCAQIETSVRDIDATRDFMITVLGAGKIEQQLAKEIGDLFPSGEHKMEHLGCGQAVFQLNEPSSAAEKFRGQQSIHQRYLDDQGACVTNLNYFVDDAVHAHDLLTGLGAKTYLRGPSTIAPCIADYGNNTSAREPEDFFFMGSRHLIGLDLEYMNPNFRRFCLQSSQYPAFVQPRPDIGNEYVRLLRLRIVVPDLQETYRNLVNIFLPSARSNPYDVRSGNLAKAFRIGLGGIEIEYCQPVALDGYLYKQLERYGPGCVSVVFGALDPDQVLARVSGYPSVSVADESNDLGVSKNPTQPNTVAHLIGSRALIGFDVSLQKIDENEFRGDVLPESLN